VLLLRSQLNGVLQSVGPLRRLKVGLAGAEAEAEWDSAVEQVAASSVRALPTSHDGVDAELDEVEQFIEKTPSVAVQQAWLVVERELQRVMEERGVPLPPPHVPDVPAALVKAALIDGTITPDTAQALRGLLVLRDLAAHDMSGTGVSPEKAAEFLLLARAVLHTLGGDRGDDARG
jgi:hypothetical protein